jgi:hypothetical protein
MAVGATNAVIHLTAVALGLTFPWNALISSAETRHCWPACALGTIPYGRLYEAGGVPP